MNLTYKDAGVDIEKANQFITSIRGRSALTMNDAVLAQVGGFAGCYELPTGYSQPVLVSGTDGVGTKVELANANTKYLLNIGQDLVAMVLNDIVCCGAKPLFFLDYLAASNLQPEKVAKVIDGMVDALHECETPLLGGETAELPGVFAGPEKFDVAGFGVGIVEKKKLIDGHANIRANDVLIGLASSGPHSNGYSLIRSILEVAAHNTPTDEFEDIIRQVMEPTTLYVKPILRLMDRMNSEGAPFKLRGVANITGGGLIENIPRIVDHWLRVSIDVNSWDMPDVYKWLQTKGNVPMDEMYNVFNMGIGMVIVVDPSDLDVTLSILNEELSMKAWKIGEVLERGDPMAPQIVLS